MKDSVILEGKIYISAKRAAKLINYAQDYIGQLCRAGKLDCKMIGRSWFVTEESLLSHRENAIDNTQERVLKVIKNNDVATKETIKAVVEEKKIESPASAPIASPLAPATPVAPIVSPIQSSSFKYETEKASFLPELKKKVPESFALPKNILKLQPAPFVSSPIPKMEVRPTAALSVSHSNTLSTTLIITLVGLGGFLFTLSMASFSTSRSISYNEASVSSAAGELLAEIMKSLGLRSRTPSTLVALDRDKIKNNAIVEEGVASTTEPNGIGIFPARSPQEDELAKQKIMNSFSDEVTIKRDAAGTTGVITPVFKKTDGNDFVYVLVPVKEKKEE